MPSLLFRIVRSVKSLLLRQVSYLDKQAYHINDDSGLWQQSSASSRLLIVSRHNYTEQIQWLPVSRRSEAKKLVKFAQSAKGDARYYVLGEPLNGKTPVVWYQFKPQVLAYSAICYLPETILLGVGCQQEDVLIYQSPDNDSDIYLCRNHAGVSSAVKGGLLQSAQQFMLAQGSALQQSTRLNATEHKKRLVQALFKLRQLPLAGLVNKTVLQRNNATHSFYRYVWPLAGAVTLYLLMASSWAQYRLQDSQSEVQQFNKAANQLLAQRENIDTMLNRYQQLQQVLPESDNLLQLWSVLAPLYQQGVTVSYLQQRQQQVTLRIEADSATEALQLLVQQPGVTQAKLDGNVRRQGKKDIATVNFVVQQEAP
jgi:hypothetical protein